MRITTVPWFAATLAVCTQAPWSVALDNQCSGGTCPAKIEDSCPDGNCSGITHILVCPNGGCTLSPEEQAYFASDGKTMAPLAGQDGHMVELTSFLLQTLQLEGDQGAAFASAVAASREAASLGGGVHNDQNLHVRQNPTARPWRCFNDNGLQVVSAAILTEVVYLVPGGKSFIWPTVADGYSVEVQPFNGDGANSSDWVTGPPIRLVTITDKPRLFNVRNFFTAAEADELIATSAPNTKRSHTGMGKGMLNTRRTSENAFDDTSEIAVRLKRRAFQMLRLDWKENMADGLQVVHYKIGQAYSVHTDYFPGGPTGLVEEHFNWDPSMAGGSNRFATVLIYLTDVPVGGDTMFPHADPTKRPRRGNVSAEKEEEELVSVMNQTSKVLSDWELRMAGQCQSKLAIHPRKGDAILFYSQGTDGKLDANSAHGGCPVVVGDKWAANLWVWNDDRYGTTPVRLCFQNDFDVAVDLFYDTTKFTQIEPDKKMCYTSYVGQQWYVKSTTGKILDSYRVLQKHGNEIDRVVEPEEKAAPPDDEFFDEPTDSIPPPMKDDEAAEFVDDA